MRKKRLRCVKTERDWQRTEMCVEWNYNTMKQGLGKLQMKKLTKITENTLEKNVFLDQ